MLRAQVQKDIMGQQYEIMKFDIHLLYYYASAFGFVI